MSTRRETMLRPPGDSTTGIPKPHPSKLMPPPHVPQLAASTSKAPNTRYSLAPGRTPLQPTQQNGGLGNSGPRQSMYPGGNPLLMSARKNVGGFGLTPGRAGRASIFGNSIASAVPGVNQPIKDNRPIRERPFQTQMSRIITTYCLENGCPVQLPPKIVTTTPTSQQYWAIVDWLVRQLDPNFPEPRQGGNLVGPTEFINVLKWFRYPFADAIDKRSLGTVGGMHSWPAMLAALHYLVSLCKTRLSYLSKTDDATLQDPEQVPEQFTDEAHHWTLAFDYYNSAYESFLSGNDEFPQERAVLEQRYVRKDAEVTAAVLIKRALHEELSAELARLSGTSAPVLKLREDWKRIQNDQNKFAVWHQHSEKRIQKHREELAREISDMTDDEKKLSELLEQQEQADLEVARQNISPEEVQRMTAEDVSLDRMINDLKVKSVDSSRAALSLEIVVANRIDSVEQGVAEYMALVYKLGLHPQPPPEFKHLSFALELNTGASDPRDLIQGENLRQTIKPALISVAEMKRKERGARDDDRVRLENDLDRIMMECENLEQEITAIDGRVRLANSEAEDMRETGQREGNASHVEIARLETELAHARAAAMSSGVGVVARLQASQIAYQEQIEKTDRLREETVRAVVKSTSEMCNFKEQVSEFLNHVRQIAEDN